MQLDTLLTICFIDSYGLQFIPSVEFFAANPQDAVKGWNSLSLSHRNRTTRTLEVANSTLCTSWDMEMYWWESSNIKTPAHPRQEMNHGLVLVTLSIHYRCVNTIITLSNTRTVYMRSAATLLLIDACYKLQSCQVCLLWALFGSFSLLKNWLLVSV